MVTDGVFSMDGDIAPLPGIVAAAEEHGAAVFVDDAHASGVLGRNGRGSVDHFDLHGRVAIQVGTLSARPWACSAGTWRARTTLREMLVQRARPFLFSTSHPPAVAAACLAAIHVLEEEPELIERLWSNTRRFKAELARLGFDTGVSETPITPVIVGDSALAIRFADRLLEEGVWATSVVYPTVALDGARLRTIVTAAHSDEELDTCLARSRASAASWAHRRVSEPNEAPRVPIAGPARAAFPGPEADRDLPLDAHLHTNLSPDSDVPIDIYCASAVARGIPEIAITDHVDFDPRDQAYAFAGVRRARAPGPGGRRAVGGRGLARPIRRRGHLRVALRGRDPGAPRAPPVRLRDRLRPRRAVVPVPGTPGSPAGSPGRSFEEIVAPYFAEVEAAIRSGLFDTLGHLDYVKKYLVRHVPPAAFAARPDVYEPLLRALVESGTALEVNASGLRQPPGETYPPAPIVARFRELGGIRVTAGSDAHRADSFAYGLGHAYAALAAAGFEALAFRRGGRRPASRRTPGDPRARSPRRLTPRSWSWRPAAGPANLRGMELLVVGSGAAYPDKPGTASSCYVVSLEGTALCLDMGQGAFAGLAGRLEPADLVAIVISHLHPDHFVDLVALRHYLRYEFDPPRRLRVIAPAGLAGRLDGVTGEADFAAERSTSRIGSRASLEVGPFDIESRRVAHTADSFAARVTLAGAPDGPGLVYSGDCGRAADLAPLIRPGDVLLTEVAFGPGPVPVADLHLDGPAVGRLAAETGAITRPPHAPPDAFATRLHDRGRAGRVHGPVALVRRRGSGDDSRADAPHRSSSSAADSSGAHRRRELKRRGPVIRAPAFERLGDSLWLGRGLPLAAGPRRGRGQQQDAAKETGKDKKDEPHAAGGSARRSAH